MTAPVPEMPAMPEPFAKVYEFGDESDAGMLAGELCSIGVPVSLDAGEVLVYTAAQLQEAVDAALRWAAERAESDEFYGSATQHAIAAAIRCGISAGEKDTK